MKSRKRTKPFQFRSLGSQRDLGWLCSLLRDVYGMRLAFLSEEGHWVGPHHADDPIEFDDSKGALLADGTPLLSMMELDPILNALRLPEIPEGFEDYEHDPAGVRWVCLRGLMRLVQTSDQPEMQAVWQSWLAEGGTDGAATIPEIEGTGGHDV